MEGTICGEGEFAGVEAELYGGIRYEWRKEGVIGGRTS